MRLLILAAATFVACLFIPFSAFAQKKDEAPPVVVFLRVEPDLIDTSLAAAAITVTLLVTDNSSGIKELSVFFRSDDTRNGLRDYVGLSFIPFGMPPVVALTTSVPLQQYSFAGRWRISHIEVVDMADNTYLAYSYPACMVYPSTCIGPQIDGTFYNVYKPLWLHIPWAVKHDR